MKRVAIYGGSFNPIHNGHTALAEAVCRAGVVDEVWFMVSPLNPLKQEESNKILLAEIRLKLARMAVEGTPQLVVSDFETKLPVPSYTITTLTELKNTYPDCIFSLLVGQDNWERFDRWYQSDVIKANHDIIVYGRNESEETRPEGENSNTVSQSDKFQKSLVTLYKKDGTEFRLSDYFSFSLFDISSTQIREALKSHQLPFVAKWLKPAVFRYVLENGLYSA